MFIKENKPYLQRINNGDFCLFLPSVNGGVDWIFYTPSLESIFNFICKYKIDDALVSQSSGQREP